MNRTIAPEAKRIEKVQLIRPERHDLSNGIPCFLLNTGSQEVLRLEFIFRAGTAYGKDVLTPSFTNSMLTEGSTKMSSKEIAEGFDYYGAFIQPTLNADHGLLSVHCLTKDLQKLMPFLKEVLIGADFPQKELDTQLSRSKQAFQVNLEKVEYLARRGFSEALFGKEHPYGKQHDLEDFSNVKRDELRQYFSSNYDAGSMSIMVAGKFGKEVHQLLNETFGALPLKEKKDKLKMPAPLWTKGRVNIKKEGAIQSGIRMGRPVGDKHHKDYIPLMILNTLLGGYFGSRLMANIREDKGYTYGIGSAIASLEGASYFFIATEVGSDVTEDALKEIRKELLRLGEEKVTETELGMVKNYMLGSFLRNSDGPFAMADRFKALYFYDLEYDYYDRYIDTIHSISADQLLELSRKYLNPDEMSEIVAGNV